MLVEIISCHIGSFLGYFVLLYCLLGVSVGILHPLLTFLHLFVVIYEPSLYCRFVTRSVKFCGWSPEAGLPTEPQSCWEIHPLCCLPLSGSISVWMPTGNARATLPLTEHTHTHTSYSAALFNTITRHMFVLHHMMPGYTKGAGRRGGDELLNCCTVHYLWKVDKVPISCSSYRCMTRWKWEKM